MSSLCHFSGRCDFSTGLARGGAVKSVRYGTILLLSSVDTDAALSVSGSGKARAAAVKAPILRVSRRVRPGGVTAGSLGEHEVWCSRRLPLVAGCNQAC